MRAIVAGWSSGPDRIGIGLITKIQGGSSWPEAPKGPRLVGGPALKGDLVPLQKARRGVEQRSR